MKALFEILLVITAFLSVIPFVRISMNRGDNKYECLKYLIYTSVVWTLLIFIERTLTDLTIVYYTHMLGFPIKFLLSFLMFCTIFQYVEKKIPNIVLFLSGFIFIADLIFALTNTETQLILKLSISDITSFSDLYFASYGVVFIFHLLASYLILTIAVIFLFVFLAKQKEIRQYKAVTRMLVISIGIVLGFNLLELFAVDIDVDLTYISLIFTAFILYEIIYSRDMIFNLRTSGRSEILSNMREMYILTDRDKRIIEISKLFLNKYKIKDEDIIGKKFEFLINLTKDKVLIYSDHNMNDNMDEFKDYYHLREKKFKLRKMNDYGYMILLYDETQVYKLLRELNKLSNFDSMTGLNNRNYIENKLKQIKETKNLGVISLDLNALKVNNDYLGHDRGDILLKGLADKMKFVFKDIKDKEMARIGGDEFLILIPNVTAKFLELKKKELLKACYHKNVEKKISVSIGYAIDEEFDTSIYQLIKQADQEMYKMKNEVSPIYKNEILEYIKIKDQFIR